MCEYYISMLQNGQKIFEDESVYKTCLFMITLSNFSKVPDEYLPLENT